MLNFRWVARLPSLIQFFLISTALSILIMNNFLNFENLSFASINCNSLNMASSGKYLQNNKVYGIAKLKTDIIFLADVRISNKNKVSGYNELKRTFLMNSYCQYKLEHNSTSNRRGCGVLIKNDLPFLELRRIADPGENYLLLLTEIKGRHLILGSIYGPNDHNPVFFRDLQRDISRLGNYPVILGGDWNCTGSTEPVDRNIDCLNMVAPPNIRHARYLRELCLDLELIDPYRGMYPARRDYTYVPRSDAMVNRSRIDFFLISSAIFANVSDCDILPSLQSKLFDHKAIVLSFYPKKKSLSNRSSISPKILGFPETELIVRTAVAECYIHNIDLVNVENFQREPLLRTVGLIKTNLRELGPPFKHTDPFFFLPEETRERNLKLLRIENLINTLNIAELQELPLVTDMATFTESLLFSIKNDVCSFQHFVAIKKNELSKSVLDSLNREKNKSPPDVGALKNLEKILLNINEAELKLEVEKSPLYEFINNEKITPEFLKLAKATRAESRLADIKKADGSDFVSHAERNEYIVQYFANIYKKPEGPDRLGEGAIENFLGQDIVNHPIVANSRLTAEEAASLEGDLTLAELDSAINECRTRSAPGPDGINNAFIKKFWYLLRIPIQKYAKYSFEAGKLSQTFCNGSIRLIPKKGDHSQIKNWRPISLLNCMYKVISRAINNRLKKVSDRILSRAQKGFTNSRFIQEVLINVIETIAGCKSRNVDGLVVAIDVAKAFDSLSHRFMEKTWQFFGFGENLTKMLKTIVSGRSSCIILDDNSYSNHFKIDSGSMQGDSPSPLIFNFNQQIMIFKVELDPAITPVFFNHIVPRPVFPAIAPFEHESNRESSKVDAFADDTTTVVEKKIENLRRLKIVLTDFGILSGLKCNFEKTNIMAVGNNRAISQDMMDTGFSFVDSLCLLGLTINFDLSSLENVHNVTITKITNICNFWSRFNLSTPGRINVAKSLLLSQINYIGCIVPPSRQQLAEINNIINRFIVGRSNISIERITLAPAEGGLGMVDLGDFLTAQQAIWIKHAMNSTRDCWRYDLMKIANGDPLTLSASDFSPATNPILNNFANSFNTVRKAFYGHNDNYRDALLLNNPLIKRGRRDNGLLSANFFNQNPAIPTAVLQNLTFADVCGDDGIRTLADINLKAGLNMNLLTFLRVGEALNFYRVQLGANRNSDGSTLSLRRFLFRFKNGSKPIRLLLSKTKKIKPITDRTHIKTFVRITGLVDPPTIHIKNSQEFWSYSFLPNNLRDFILKFNSNLLGLNTRVSNFVLNHSRACTFCSLGGGAARPDETFIHIFFDCPVTDKILKFFERLIFSEKNLDNPADRKKLWFLGIFDDAQQKNNLFLGTAIWVVKSIVWDLKLKKKLPVNHTLKRDFFYTMGNIYDFSVSVRIDKSKHNFSFCRNWDELRRD